MGTIVLHAGMPKTGSTSIQRWIERDSAWMRRQHGIEPVVVRPGTPDRPRVVQHRGGPVTSGPIVKQYRDLDRPKALMSALARELDARARHSACVLVTAEHFADLLRRPDEHFATALEQLAGRHAVRVAYYVRPQHTAVEAAWKQYGFRDPHERPSAFVAATSRTYQYLRTYHRARRAMPNVAFEVRPFRVDLLHGRDVVVDFAQHFLGIAVTGAADAGWSNPALPLEVANLLHAAPRPLFPHTRDGLLRLNALKEQLSGWAPPETPAIRRSRMIVQQHCHDEHESDNRKLSRRLRWQARAFVPPVDWRGETPGSLDELDTLWRPGGTAAEQALCYATLRGLVGEGGPARPRRALRERAAAVVRRLRAGSP